MLDTRDPNNLVRVPQEPETEPILIFPFLAFFSLFSAFAELSRKLAGEGP